MNKTKNSASSRSLFFLAVILATNRLITEAFMIYTTNAGTGAPISSLVSGVLILAVMWFFSHRLIYDAQTDIFDTVENKPGKIPLTFFGILLTCYLFLNSAYLLTETTDLLKLISFPESPLWFIGIFPVFGALCGAFGGSNNILRISGFIAVFFLIVMTFLIFSVLFQSKSTNLFPILGTGIDGTIKGGLSGITLYTDILMVFLLKPQNSSKKTVRRTIIISTVIVVLFTLLLTITYTAKIPYPISAQEKFPVYLLLKEVYFGRFFQRIDAIFLLSSTLCQMFSLGLNLYLIFKIFRRIFNITSKRAVLFPVAIILFWTVTGLITVSAELITVTSYALFGLFALIAFIPRKEEPKTYEN